MAGLSIRAIARQVGLSRSQVHRIISNPAPDMSPIAYLGPEDDDDDPWTAEVPLADDDEDAAEPVLVPPFDAEGLVELPDSFPTRRRDGKVRRAPQWRDADGQPVTEMDLWRWGLRLHDIIPADYGTREEYLAAWDAADAEIEAVKAHAWDSLAAAGVYRDDRGRWVQRARAV